MGSALHELPTATLRCLAGALRSGVLRPPVTGAGLSKLGLRDVPAAAVAEMQDALGTGVGPLGVAWGLERLAAERDSAAASRPELVWTGPEVAGSLSRDTAVVVRELFRGAERSVLVSTYAVYQGAQVFQPLAERMQAVPGLSVRIFLNIEPPDGAPPGAMERVLRDFGRRFREKHWPEGVPLPQLFYDPRTLRAEPGAKACLHAKCIVVDDKRAFVSSANFTEAAHERNIEAGVLVEDPAFARALRDQFESLVTGRLLLPVPGVTPAASA